MGCTTRQGLLADEGDVLLRRAKNEIEYITERFKFFSIRGPCREPQDLRVIADMLAEAIGDKEAIILASSSMSWEPRPAPVHADNQPLAPRRKPANVREQLLTEMGDY